MAEAIPPSAITGIRGADSEGFIASTLFTQGWNVHYRALDFSSLLTFLDSTTSLSALLFLSTDLEGLTPIALEELRSRNFKFILFTPTELVDLDYPESIAPPKSALEVMALVRGSQRAPLFRSVQPRKVRARTIAIAGAAASLGCTTLAINLGKELALAGKRVLIVDGHAYAPAIASLLGQRGLNTSHEVRNIAENFYALEITQTSITSDILILENSRADFDYIIIDSGVLRDFTASITGRRWSCETLIWSTFNADELWIMSKSDLLGLERLRGLISEITGHSMKPTFSFIHVHRTLGKRSKDIDKTFLNVTTPLRPTRLWQYPWDSRSISSAEEETATLHDSNERSLLRKTILEIAGELIT